MMKHTHFGPSLALALALATTQAAPTLAQDARRAMTEHDLVTLNRLDAPAVSPDGRWAVYQVTTTNPDTLVRTTHLELLDLSRKSAQPVVLSGANMDGKSAHSSAFAANGQRIYFLSGANGGVDQIWSISANPLSAQAPIQESFGKADVAGFKLSPDGGRALVWGDIGIDCPTFGCDESGNTATPGPGSGRLYDRMFVRHWDHWETPGNYQRPFVVRLANGDSARATATPVAAGLAGDSPSKPNGGGDELNWSADGKAVFFTLRKADRDEPTSTNLDVWRAPADGSSAPENLTADNAATDTLPTPSPDGKWLAWVAMARPTYEADRQVLKLRDLSSGAVRTVTDKWDRSIDSLAWAPDSKSLMVTAQDTLDHPAFRVTLDGRVTRLTASGSVTNLIPLPRGGALVTTAGIANPNRLGRMTANGRVTTLINPNSANEAAVGGVTVRKFSFAGANGATVWGVITKPAGVTGKLPVAFIVHGGPQGSFGDGWSYRWSPRIFAAQGYAVVSVDFHGSTGYGQAFTDSINKDWGGKPLVDLKAGLAAAGKLDPQVDTTNACALGASYGGYMMNWISSQWNDGFKCIVNHAGVFDLRAMAFETEELWFDEWDHGGPWWSRQDAERWNPVNHVTKWRIPTLVTHGEKDFRIPYSQSLAAFTALQRQGIESQLLIFPDENHWITKPKNSVQWHRTVFDWLAKHLKK